MQVAQLQLALQEMQQQVATTKHTGPSQQVQASATDIAKQSTLQSVKHHAAALAEAAAAFEHMTQCVS